ncbi:TetR/AcrR family transcriptional regulator [Streptomyces sp. 4N509B]|uniref:TetR/AcrR family transcriptional regulator n=1 Tax=Streptomyces sp. 4N509B TaxID=3457413 RepID=UPI003FCEED1E
MTTAHHSGSGDIARSLQLLWQGREQASRGPKPTLTLEGIVTAAVALADEEGLAALSMRRVAATLGVGTMTLYRYVPGKAELLDLMLDRVNGPGEEAGESSEEEARRLGELGWREGLEHIGAGLFRLYERHPWLLQINQSRPLLGPNSLRGFDLALSVLEGLRLTSQEKVTVITIIDSFVTGIARAHILQRQVAEQTGISDEEFWRAQTPIIEIAMSSGCYPHVFALDEDAFSLSNEETMRFGLARILDGLASFLDSRNAD